MCLGLYQLKEHVDRVDSGYVLRVWVAVARRSDGSVQLILDNLEKERLRTKL